MSHIFLDTNAYVEFIKGEKKVVNEIKEADKVYISLISIGELYSGYFKGTRFTINEEVLHKFLNNLFVQVSGLSQRTARVYGEVSLILHKKGTPLPTNDMWIAAQAIENDSILVTYDRHFLQIPDVKVWKYL